MRGLRNLRQKNGIFVFRRKVPVPLQPLVKRRELIRSLGRCSAREARVKAAHLWLATERIFNVLAQTQAQANEDDDADLVTPAQVRLFIDRMLANSQFNDEYATVAYDSEEFRRLNPTDRQVIQLVYGAKRLRTSLVKNDFSGDDFARTFEELRDLSKELGITIRRGSISEKIIARELLRETANYYEQSARRESKEHGLPEPAALEAMSPEGLRDLLRERFGDTDPFPRSAVTASSEVETDEQNSIGPANRRLAKLNKTLMPNLKLYPGRRASEVWPLFLLYRKEVKKKKETANKLTSSLNLWHALHGDLPVNQWTHDMAERLCRLFLDLPYDYAQSNKWRGYNNIKDIRDAYQNEIENARDEDRLRLKEGGTSITTWNRHNSTLSKFCDWAKLNELTTAPKNPFDGLWINTSEDDPVADGGSEKRLPWPEEQLRLLFSSPLFTGCKSLHRRHVPGTLVMRDALYWVPLIIAYTGMRREEVCQLRVEHLCHDEKEGIYYFNLKAKGLRLKNTRRGDTASKRWVPLPDALLSLGIIESLHAGRCPNEQLFTELYRCKAHDTFGSKLGQQFTAYRKNYDSSRQKNLNGDGDFEPIYKRWMDLHAFRHSVCTDLINLRVPQAHAEELTGHKSEARKTAFATYNQGATLTLLKDAIDRRRLPIDLPRLIAAAEHSSAT